MKTIILGSGPAGMMAAITAKSNYPDMDVTILEKNNTLGKKLLITGKGRCNITSSLDISKLLVILHLPLPVISNFLPKVLFFSNIVTSISG